jgi:S-adenosylmethionine synthetase
VGVQAAERGPAQCCRDGLEVSERAIDVPLIALERVEVGPASAFVKERFDFRPRAIIERLNLLRPIFRSTTNYGHFGRAGLPWETPLA